MRRWPVILGGAFVLGLLGTQIGRGKFADINLAEVIYKTLGALLFSALLSAMIQSATESIANKGDADRVRTNQVAGMSKQCAIGLLHGLLRCFWLFRIG
jgi:hypothetical protein